ncbi:MAG: GNAT family N-acetyltransferase [Ruminococcaceae bacterium]|nr:GNAT family N-acetyltransferase [Oscillospiraceae bacterium]
MKKENLLHIFSRMPQLETERLLLRPMRVTDAQDMFEYAKSEEVTRYLLWRPHPDVAYTRSYLEYLAGRYRLGTCYEWAVTLKQEKRMIGTCGFASISCPDNTAELGYVLNPRYRGMGLMPEAAKRVMRFGFDVMNLHRIEARYMVGNDASLQVMKKLGMRFEGVKRESMLVKGAYRDIATCAILAREFRHE